MAGGPFRLGPEPRVPYAVNRRMNKEQLQRLEELRRKVDELRGYL